MSTKLLKEWLVKYKFKDWTKTETRQKAVTTAMKDKRAKEIADKLNDTNHWSSHARPISMEVVRKELNLKIEDFGEPSKSALNLAIKCYHQLLRDYMAKTRKMSSHHTDGHYLAIEVEVIWQRVAIKKSTNECAEP